MDKFIFLKIEGTLLHKQVCDENKPLFSNKFGEEAIHLLDTLIKYTEAKIILLDAPKETPFIQTLQKFTDAGFEHQQSIIGQIVLPEMVEVKTPYDELGLKPFPIMLGNCIKHWVDNFIATPYKLNPEQGLYFEIWEKPTEEADPKFKGMKVLEENKDFKYRILGNVSGLLAEQEPKNISSDFNYGLTQENAKKLILSF